MWHVEEEVKKQEYGWLSTLEYLPPFDRAVLVYVEGNVRIGVMPVNGAEEPIGESDAEVGVDIQEHIYQIKPHALHSGKVSHWMHIPPVPGE